MRENIMNTNVQILCTWPWKPLRKVSGDYGFLTATRRLLLASGLDSPTVHGELLGVIRKETDRFAGAKNGIENQKKTILVKVKVESHKALAVAALFSVLGISYRKL